MSQILRVTKAFSVLSDPNGHVYTPGELVDAAHPHVKGREGNFETVEAHVSARAGVSETATAAPGERRTRSAPRKARTAKRTATKKAALTKPIKGVLVESDVAGTGEAVNADTGEVTAPGDPLPPVKD